MVHSLYLKNGSEKKKVPGGKKPEKSIRNKLESKSVPGLSPPMTSREPPSKGNKKKGTDPTALKGFDLL